MIELRWLEKTVQEHNVHVAHTVRVLQFRESIEGNWQPRTVWTEWQDVPTVKDE
jgi:hypothetical protein